MKFPTTVYEIWHKSLDGPLVVQEKKFGYTTWNDSDSAIADAKQMKKKWPACDLVVIEITITGWASTAQEKKKIFDTSEE
jgi:hypothetical protein